MNFDSKNSIVIPITNGIVWQLDNKTPITIYHQLNPNPKTGASIASIVAFLSDNEEVPAVNSDSENFIGVPTVDTNGILWQLDDEIPITIYHQFNPNPETGTNTASVVAFESDEESVPVQNGIHMQIDYDLQSDRFTHFRSNGCDCLRVRLEKVLSQQREKTINWLQKARNQAKDELQRCIFDSDLCDGSMIEYHELIPGVSAIQSEPVFAAGSIIVHNGNKWWVTDLYCAEPDCPCHDTLLIFRIVDDLISSKPDTICVEYTSPKPYSIREIDEERITIQAAHDVVQEWFAHKPIWFTDAEIRARSGQMKRVMARTIQHRKMPGTANDRQVITVGRNAPCPCGSGHKFKKCCGKG